MSEAGDLTWIHAVEMDGCMARSSKQRVLPSLQPGFGLPRRKAGTIPAAPPRPALQKPRKRPDRKSPKGIPCEKNQETAKICEGGTYFEGHVVAPVAGEGVGEGPEGKNGEEKSGRG